MMLQPKSGVHFSQLSSFVSVSSLAGGWHMLLLLLSMLLFVLLRNCHLISVLLLMLIARARLLLVSIRLLALCMNASQHHTSCHQNLLCLPKIWLTLDNMASQGLLHLKQSRKHTTPYQSKHEISVVISTHTNSSRAVVLGQDTNPKHN